MPATRETVLELLERIDETAVGHRVSLAERAVALADELGDGALCGQARIYLVQAYNYTNDRTRMFAPFTWMLQRYDDPPDWFEDSEREFVLWTYKWMVGGLIAIRTSRWPSCTARWTACSAGTPRPARACSRCSDAPTNWPPTCTGPRRRRPSSPPG